MNTLLREIRHNPLLWLLAFVPVVFAAQKLKPDAHTLLFVLSVLAIFATFAFRVLAIQFNWVSPPLREKPAPPPSAAPVRECESPD